MIISKYVVGDVVVIDGKQQIILVVDHGASYELHQKLETMYKLNNGKWYFEDELDANSIN